MPEATELEYLRWFFENSDFGPADYEVKEIMEDDFQRRTGKNVPKSCRQNSEEDDG